MPNEFHVERKSIQKSRLIPPPFQPHYYIYPSLQPSSLYKQPPQESLKSPKPNQKKKKS